jgi:uncharacterized protein (UPF0210 family)
LNISAQEILETIRMIEVENFDIRTVTLGMNLLGCARPKAKEAAALVREQILFHAERLVKVVDDIQAEYGVPIINRRIAVTPIALLANALEPGEECAELGRALDDAARTVGINFIGGYSALVEKGYTKGDQRLIASIPEVLAQTETVCSSVNVASSRAGINMDAIRIMGGIVKETATLTQEKNGAGCAKLVVFSNIPEDNPFMAGAVHGVGQPELVINVGVSGPGVVLDTVRKQGFRDLGALAEAIKRTAFKITRVGQLVGQEASQRLGVQFGVVDLSLAPTPAVGDSVADILEAMGLEMCGAPGTTAALAMLIDAVKKGGAMASSYVGGLSGAFIPVSEDAGMVRAVKQGALTLEKLEAMTAVCSVGLDMVVVPGDTSADTISGIIADEIAIGVINHKTTGVRIIPAPGRRVGDMVDFGGLLGSGPVMPVNQYKCADFINRGGRIPAPLHSLRN